MDFERIIAVRTKKTIYRDNGRVYKVFDEDYKKSDVLNEAINDARAEEANLSVPKLLDVGLIDGKWAITQEYIEGSTLWKLIEENPDDVNKYLDQFVDLQLSVINIEIPHLNKNKDKLRERINAGNFSEATKYELLTVLDNLPTHHHALHGDFVPQNVIIRKKDGKPFIIDWAHLSEGNASFDIANTYLSLQLTGELTLAENYLEKAIEKSHIEKSYIQKWIPLVAALKLSNCRKEEEEFLKHHINVVDHQ